MGRFKMQNYPKETLNQMRKNWIDWLADKGIPARAYSVNEAGQVWSTESEQYLIPQENKGYLQVDLKWEGSRVKIKLHRAVAMAFLDPPEEGQNEVNHIDGNRKNNRVTNLEWTNHSENIQHRNKVLKSDPGGKKQKPVALVYMDQADGIRICKSHTEAIKLLNTSPPTFYKSLSTGDEIDGIVVYPIQNPEVVVNARNQNGEKQGGHSESETGVSDPRGTEESQGEQGRGDVEQGRSEIQKQALEKWGGRGRKNQSSEG